jgi:hypothetical protein
MNTFLAVFNAFPAILGAVQAVETAVPLPKSGQTKLNLVLNAAATAWELSQVEQQTSANSTLNAISAIASLSVSELNAAGVFQHATPAAATPATPAPTAAPVSSN